jgi:hypothetical protein
MGSRLTIIVLFRSTTKYGQSINDYCLVQIHDEIWAGVGGAWAGGGAGGGLDGGFFTRSALGTNIAVDESGTAVAVAAREHWLAVHPLDTRGTSPGHVFAGGGSRGGSEWIMVEQLDGAVRDLCFVPGGGHPGSGEASGKGEATLAICLLKHSDGGAGSVVLVRACWGGGDAASTHIVTTLVPPTSGDMLGEAALGRAARHQENAGEGQGGVGSFLTGVTSMPGKQGLVMVTDEAGVRVLDLAPFCGNAQAGPVGNVGEVCWKPVPKTLRIGDAQAHAQWKSFDSLFYAVQSAGHEPCPYAKCMSRL